MCLLGSRVRYAELRWAGASPGPSRAQRRVEEPARTRRCEDPGVRTAARVRHGPGDLTARTRQLTSQAACQEGIVVVDVQDHQTHRSAIIAGLALALGIGLATSAAGRAPRRRSGTRSPSARAAATGRSTPATATTVDCSSPRRPGRASAARSTPARPTGQASPSRSRSPAGCSPSRVRAPGRPAADARPDQEEWQGRPERRPATNPGATKAKAEPVAKKAKPAAKKAKAVVTKAPASASRQSRSSAATRSRKLAKRHHVKGGWKGLWKLNKKPLKNPNRI